MGRYSTDTGGGDFKQAPAGTHVARCIKLIDIGTHHGEYQGTPTVRNQVIVQWELPHETMEVEGETRPLIVSKFYTNSLSEKANLRKDLESWRAKTFSADELMKFDLQQILGVAAMLSIVQNDKGKAQVASVSKIPKGFDVPEAHNTPEAFWLDEFDQESFEMLSKGFKKLIMESDEWARISGAPRNDEDFDRQRSADEIEDDIPF